MGRLANFKGREFRRVAEMVGWEFQRVKGDHFIYAKPGVRYRLSIPDHSPVREGTARDLIHDMGITVDEFLRLAKK